MKFQKNKVKKAGVLEVKLDDSSYVGQPSPVYGYSRFVCQIHRDTFKGRQAIGTGFLVGPQLVLTCFHVVENIAENNLYCRFDVKYTGANVPTWGPFRKIACKLAISPYSEAEGEGTYCSSSNEHPNLSELDYALLQLEDRVDTDIVEIQHNVRIQRSWLPLASGIPNVIKDQIYILQHPDGQQQLASDGLVAEDQPLGGVRMRYRANTERGSSGSPCFQWAGPSGTDLELVAVHNYGDPGWHASNDGFNHGVPVHHIVNDIADRYPEQAAKLLRNCPRDIIVHDAVDKVTTARIVEIRKELNGNLPLSELERLQTEIVKLSKLNPPNIDILSLHKDLECMIENNASSEILSNDRRDWSGLFTRKRKHRRVFIWFVIWSLLIIGILSYLAP